MIRNMLQLFLAPFRLLAYTLALLAGVWGALILLELCGRALHGV